VRASETLREMLKKGDVVVYESAVYPGLHGRGLRAYSAEGVRIKVQSGFFAGYSPERVNQGDRQHRLPNMLKVTPGSTPAIAQLVVQLYRSIITAGTYRASCIRVAEAAKVIEDTQSDLNIALINELALIF